MFALYFLLSHCVADYCLQHRSLAMNKFKMTSEGWRDCFFHSAFYSAVFSIGITLYDWKHLSGEAFTGTDLALFFWMVFLTHFPIDKISAGKYIMKIMGREIEGVDVNEKIVSWVVYVAIDLTIHLILLVLGIEIFFPELV